MTEPWRLARRSPSGPSTSGTCAHAGTGPAEQVEQVRLARRGVEQVVAAHHLLDALVVVVDHDGHVVRRHAVVAAQDDVVGRPGDRAVQPVDDRDRLRRRRAGAAPPAGPRPRAAATSRGGEVAARAGVGAGRRVRRRARLADLPAAAEARVGEASRRPASARAASCSVAALGLAHDGPVPVEARAPPGRRAGRPRAPAGSVTGSRSSIRSRNRLPAERAKSQASSAVRRLPEVERPRSGSARTSAVAIRRSCHLASGAGGICGGSGIAATRRPGAGWRLATRDVVLVVFPGLQGLDLIGPAEVFAAANQEVGRPAYRVRRRRDAAGTGRTRAAASPSSPTRPSPTCARPIDTLMVVGGDGTYGAVADEHLVSHVGAGWPTAPAASRACAPAPSSSPRPGSSTAGAPPPTGASCDLLARSFPAVDVDPDPIYVRDGNVWTSAGVTAGMDLALALVEDDHGRDVALAIARRFVLFLRRPANQSQFSAPLQAQAAEHDGIRAAQHHVAEHPEADCSRRRARPGRADERAQLRPLLHRRDRRDPGSLRRARPRRDRPPAARGHRRRRGGRRAAAGFGTAETMRRTFLRLVRTSPTEYRRRFRAA